MSSLFICTVYQSVFNLIELCKYMLLFYSEESDKNELLDGDEHPPKAMQKAKKVKFKKQKPR